MSVWREHLKVNWLQRPLYNTLDSTCVLIGLQVCFDKAMKHENDVSNTISCLQVVRI